MPSFLTSVAIPALVLIGGTFANPLKRNNDACLAAVTGKAALGDDNIRKSHCSSFIKTVVTPAAITVTTTITDAPEPTGWENFKRAVTVCPNEVPNYASACDEPGYKSACSVYGIYEEATFTIPATTTTKTVYKGKGDDGSCTDGTSTVTSTITAASATTTTTVFHGNVTVTSTVTQEVVTVTITQTGTGNLPAATGKNENAGNHTSIGNSKCITQQKADYFINGFIDLLEYTSYAGNNFTVPPTPAGRGYHQNVSDAILATDFTDYSDSINWMAGIELGSVTFPNKIAFDQGQGLGQPEVSVEALDTWYGCNTVTWRWRITTLGGAQVQGINHFIISDDGEKIASNYAEFNNAAWLSSFGLSCKVPAGGH